jgi:magnesium transporter
MNPEAVRTRLASRDFSAVQETLNSMNAVDAAELISQLPQGEKVLTFRLLYKDRAVAVFEQMELTAQRSLLESFATAAAQDLFNAMSPDDRTRLLDEVPAMVAPRLLELLSPAEREATLALLGYEKGTAGRAMTPDFLYLRRDRTVAQAIERIRKIAPQKETVYYAYVIDDERRLMGVVSLRELIIAPPEALVGDMMTPNPKYVHTWTDVEEVANLLSEYDLLAIPVVDREDRLVGIITWDDAMDILQEEVTEDMYRMAGVGVRERATSPLLESAKRRIPWLGFNMVWAFAGAAIISTFEDTIDRVAALVVFMPIISGQAGNSGIQTATITIRSMALGEIEWRHLGRLLAKEWGLALIKGAAFGLALGLIAWAWKDNAVLGMVAGTALLANMFIAATTGVALPLTLKRLGLDPAPIAGVFDTMLTDFMGFVIYLGLATLLVSRLV